MKELFLLIILHFVISDLASQEIGLFSCNYFDSDLSIETNKWNSDIIVWSEPFNVDSTILRGKSLNEPVLDSLITTIFGSDNYVFLTDYKLTLLLIGKLMSPDTAEKYIIVADEGRIGQSIFQLNVCNKEIRSILLMSTNRQSFDMILKSQSFTTIKADSVIHTSCFKSYFVDDHIGKNDAGVLYDFYIDSKGYIHVVKNDLTGR